MILLFSFFFSLFVFIVIIIISISIYIQELTTIVMMLVDILLVDTFNACQHYPTRQEKKRNEMRNENPNIFCHFIFIILVFDTRKQIVSEMEHHTHTQYWNKNGPSIVFWSVRFQLCFQCLYASVKYPRTSEKSVIYLYLR